MLNRQPGAGQVSGRYHIGSALSAVHLFRCWDHAAEYGGDTVSRYSPERIRYAARLHQAHRQADTGDRRCSARQRFFRSSADENGITHIMLVIHAWHMPRAAKEFEQAGFKVTSAATTFTTRYRTDAAGVYPHRRCTPAKWIIHA